ncbi:MAG: hypothetical protein LC792_06035, partial [Actinobacteria bacterium]|nr:hypothetical protein [Actinomycetota bacterium]
TDVAGLIARTLGIKELPEHPLVPRLAGYLTDKALLLVLDDLDQADGAAEAISALLLAAPHLQVLATSSGPLGLPAERDYPLSTLAVPDPGRLDDIEAVQAAEAVALFAARAREAKPQFLLDDANLAAVAGICLDLDGLPLAIELAAAHVGSVTPDAIRRGLMEALEPATSGGMDEPTPAQRLTAALDWTYKRLGAEEQLLFERLSVFADGCSLAAVEAVSLAVTGADAGEAEILCLLEERKLVRQIDEPETGPRFEMLAPVRRYGLERLLLRHDVAALRRAHAGYYVALAEEAETARQAGGVGDWPSRLDHEHRNLVSALAWSEQNGETELTVRLAAALQMHWEDGLLSEGRRWLEPALARAGSLPERTRAKGSYVVGILALLQTELDRASTLAAAAVEQFRHLGDAAGTMRSLWAVAWAELLAGRYDRAAGLFEESLGLARALDDEACVAQALTGLGRALAEEAETGRAREVLERGLALRRLLGNDQAVANSLANLGRLALLEGREDDAVVLLDESIARSRELGECMAAEALHAPTLVVLDQRAERIARGRELGERLRSAEALHTRALAAIEQQDLPAAAALAKERLVIAHHLGDRLSIAEGVEAIAATAEVRQAQAATRLFGFADGLRARLGAPPWRLDLPRFERLVDPAREHLGGEAYEEAWTSGRTIVLEEAVAQALDLAPGRRSRPVH